MAVVIDDRVLLHVLAGQPPANFGELSAGGVYTTSSWYYRLGRAIFGESRSGSLSRELAALGVDTAERVRSTLVRLPSGVVLFHPRLVVPAMFTLRVRRHLNMLNAEALAVALLARAPLVVSTHSPLLSTPAEELGLDVHVVG